MKILKEAGGFEEKYLFNLDGAKVTI